MKQDETISDREDVSVRAFTHRALDPEVAAKLGARFQSKAYQFDFTRNGKLQFRKFKNLKDEYWIEPKGAKLQFWNLDDVPVLPERPAEPLVITEGEMDKIAVVQSCGGYVLSVPNGSSGIRSKGDILIADDTKFSYLWEGEKLLPEVEQFDRVILCVDGDAAGEALRDDLSIRIGPTRCWFVEYPKGCKDANDVLKAYGEDAVRAMIKNAKPMRPGRLIRPSEIPPHVNAESFSSGWKELNKHLRFRRPEFVAVTGEPGHGKGQFLRALSYRLAEIHGWKTSFLTPEDPPRRHRRDMLRFAKRKYLKRYSGEAHYEITPEQEAEAIEWIDNHFRISTPDEDEPLTLEYLEAEMEAAALHHGCQVFICDPWNEIEHDFGKLTETQYTERTIVRLKRKMRRLNLLLIVAVHPTKLAPDETATLYKINGSANWRNKCDHGIIIDRPGLKDNGDNGDLDQAIDMDNFSQIIVEKSKDWEEMGIPGSVYLKFDRDRCDYVFAGNVK